MLPLPHSGEEVRAMRSEEQPRPCQVSGCVYLGFFTALYGLSFSMPFWGEDLSPTTDSPSTVHPAAEHPASMSETRAAASFSDVWKYSWEWTGLAMRCLTLLLLLLGCAVSVCHAVVCHLPWFRKCHALPPSMPVLCGIVAGVLGMYGELVLWLGMYLLAPNQALIESLIFSSVTSLFCFFVGLAVFWSKVRLDSQTPASTLSIPDQQQDYTTDDLEHICHLCRRNIGDFRGDQTGFQDTGHRQSATPAIEEVLVHVDSGQGQYDGDEQCSECRDEEDDELARSHKQAFASHLDAQRCPPEDLPDDLKVAGEGGLLDSLHGRSPSESEGCHLKNRPDDLRELLPDRGNVCKEVDLTHSGDFRHRDQFIDDDLYYHTSDDEHLERFIRAESSLQEQQSPTGSGLSRTTDSSTSRLIHTERALLLPFADSDEFHSFSDDDQSCKNRTWP